MLKGHMKQETGNIRELVLTTPDYQPRASPILFYRLGAVSVWESAGRSGSAGACGKAAGRGFRCQQVPRMEYGLAGGKEPRQDRRPARCGAW